MLVGISVDTLAGLKVVVSGLRVVTVDGFKVVASVGFIVGGFIVVGFTVVGLIFGFPAQPAFTVVALRGAIYHVGKRNCIYSRKLSNNVAIAVWEK